MGLVVKRLRRNKKEGEMQGIAILIFSLLSLLLPLVSPRPKSDPEYLYIHLHSNRTSPGEIALDIHPSELDKASNPPDADGDEAAVIKSSKKESYKTDGSEMTEPGEAGPADYIVTRQKK